MSLARELCGRALQAIQKCRKPLQAHLIAQDGRSTGYDLASSALVSDIPRSGYTSELNSLDDTVPSGQDPVKVLEVLRPAPGAYTLELIGTGGGAFAVDPLSLVWTGPFGQASGTNVGAAFPIGSSMVSITANDGRGGAASDSASITVRDTTAPKASAQLIATCRPEKTRVVFVSASDARMFAQRPPRGLR